MAEGEDVLAKMGQDLIKESYGDLVKPTAKDIGEALSGIFKAVTFYPRYWAMISDISLEEKVARFREKLAKNVEVIPPEFRVLPPPSILGPSVQALEYGVIEDDISDMFANLIASSMDSSKSGSSHPSFVEIIKQINPDEAKILRLFASQKNAFSFFPVADVVFTFDDGSGFIFITKNQSYVPEDAGCSNIDFGPQYLENLQRLNLVDLPDGSMLASTDVYVRLEKWFSDIEIPIPESHKGKGKPELQKKRTGLTSFGWQFVIACVLEKPTQDSSRGVTP